VWKACRGNELDSGIEAFEAADATAEQPPPQRIPIEADFLYAYSTTPGTYVVYLTAEILLLLNQQQCACASSVNHCVFDVIDGGCC